MRIFYVVSLVLILGLLQGCFPVAPPADQSPSLLAHDMEAAKAFVQDEKIEVAAAALISKQIKTDNHVNVTSTNRRVLLTGEVPDKATKAEIGKIASGIENVLSVNNELLISANSTMASRNSDSLITDDVKQRFIKDSRINSNPLIANRIHVITENGTVFLTGSVSRAVAAAAASVAKEASGVKRVVSLLEFVD